MSIISLSSPPLPPSAAEAVGMIVCMDAPETLRFALSDKGGHRASTPWHADTWVREKGYLSIIPYSFRILCIFAAKSIKNDKICHK